MESLYTIRIFQATPPTGVMRDRTLTGYQRYMRGIGYHQQDERAGNNKAMQEQSTGENKRQYQIMNINTKKGVELFLNCGKMF